MLDQAPPVDALPTPQPILPLERLGAALEAFICSGLPTQLFLILLLAQFGLPIELADGKLSPDALFALSLADTALVSGLVVVLLRAHRESPRAVLLGNRRPLREVALGLALIPLLFVLVALVIGIVIYYFPYLRNVPQNPLEDVMRSRGDTIAFAFVVMIGGGLREEIQRGFIVHRFDQYLGGGAVGVMVYSALFGLLHYMQGWDASIATACLGATWGFVYLRRRSIVAPVVSHAGFNLLQIAKALALR